MIFQCEVLGFEFLIPKLTEPLRRRLELSSQRSEPICIWQTTERAIRSALDRQVYNTHYYDVPSPISDLESSDQSDGLRPYTFKNLLDLGAHIKSAHINSEVRINSLTSSIMKSLSDCIIIVQNTKFRSFSTLLSVRCPYFKVLFESKFKETEDYVITLKDV